MSPSRLSARSRARVLAAMVVALAAIGAASSAMPGTLLAHPAWEGGAGSTGASGSNGPAGATGPTGATRPAGAVRRTPCRRPRLHLRCPDLIMSAPSQLLLDRTTWPGHVLLRATSSIDNHGQGPLEIRARRKGPYRWSVYQAIYDAKGRAHLFRTHAQLTFKYVPGERYGYQNVGSSSYWKFEHAAGFELWSIGPHRHALKLLRKSPKVDYCLRDLLHTFPLPRSPSSPVYPGCNQDPNIRSDVLGTSVGWTDSYPYDYPQQWIDVTGLRGKFAYVQTVDPDHLLIESDYRNDVSETYVELPSGRVLGYRIGVDRP